MCHFWAEIISRWCADKLHIDQDQKEKIWYGMEVFLELLWKLVAIIVIGLLMKNKGVYFLSIFSFCLLRIWVGGKHFHSSITCFGFMVLVGYLPVCVGKIYIIPWYLGEVFLIFSFGIIAKYSLYNQWYLLKETKQKRKLCAYIVLILYMLNIFFIKVEVEDIIKKLSLTEISKIFLMPVTNNRKEMFACQKDFIKFCIERNFRYANRLQLQVWDTDEEKII